MDELIPWKVHYSNLAETDLDNMPRKIAREAVLKMREVVKDPYTYLHKLRGNNLYSFKIKSYRGIIFMKNRKLVLLVVKIKHRQTSYSDL